MGGTQKRLGGKKELLSLVGNKLKLRAAVQHTTQEKGRKISEIHTI